MGRGKQLPGLKNNLFKSNSESWICNLMVRCLLGSILGTATNKQTRKQIMCVPLRSHCKGFAYNLQVPGGGDGILC